MPSQRRHLLLAVIAVPALLAGSPVLPALAQSGSAGSTGDATDLVPVAVWTIVAVVLALLVTSVGYLYRREQGMDRPLHAPPVDAFTGHESHDESRDAAGHALPGHVLVEHAAAQHDDATEQAKLLHEQGPRH